MELSSEVGKYSYARSWVICWLDQIVTSDCSIPVVFRYEDSSGLLDLTTPIRSSAPSTSPGLFRASLAGLRWDPSHQRQRERLGI